MIVLASINNREVVQKDFDIRIMATRFCKNLPSGFIHDTLLAPSKENLLKAKQMEKEGTWNQVVFDTWYAPTFYEQMKNTPASRQRIIELIRLSNAGKRILICCCCRYPERCHRRVLASIFQRKTQVQLR